MVVISGESFQGPMAALRGAAPNIVLGTPTNDRIGDTAHVVEVTVQVRNPSGLHARPAALFVKTAGGLPAPVQVTNVTRDASRTVSAKSLLAVLGLGVSSGHEIRISADGEGAEASVEALRRLVADGLGESLAT
jgi:phosphotransferase system HPr (HPr) family protein